MSFDKLNELIQSAPEFRQWWSKNHTQIQTALKRKRRMGLSVLGVSFVAVQGFTAWTFFNAPLTLVWGPMMFIGMIICLLALLLFVTGVVDAFKHWNRKWPKNCPRPLETVINPDNILDGTGKEIWASDPLHQKNLLDTIAHHPNADVRVHADSVLALKDGEMPNIWWRALEVLLEEMKDTATNINTPQQQLDNVSVEMPHNNLARSNKRKVFRL